MEFGWSADDLAFRAELRAWLDAELPPDWDEIAKGGPGSDEQVAFSRRFCAALAERGWLTQHWPAALRTLAQRQPSGSSDGEDET